MEEILLDFDKILAGEKQIIDFNEKLATLNKHMDNLVVTGEKLDKVFAGNTGTGKLALELQKATTQLTKLNTEIEKTKQVQIQAEKELAEMKQSQADKIETLEKKAEIDRQKRLERESNEEKKLAKQREDAIKSLEAQRSKAHQKNFEEQQKAIKKQEEHTAALKNEGKTLEELRAKLAALVRERNKMDTSSVGFKNITKEAGELNEKIKGMESQIGDYRRNVGNYAGGIKSFFTSIVSPAGLAMGAVYAVGSAFSDAVDNIKQFQVASNELSAITGLVGKDLRALEVDAVNMGSRLNMSATSILDSFKKVGSMSPELLKNTEALKSVTEAAITLSKAGSIDLDMATAAVTASMNQFNLSGAEASRIINTLAAGSLEGSAEIGDLTEAFKNVGTEANSSNMSLEQTVASLEVLATKSITGAEAGTKMRGVLVKLKDAGLGYASGQFNLRDAIVEANKKIDEQKTALEKDALAQKFFGTENITAGKTMLANLPLLDELTKKVTGTKVAYEQFAATQKGLAFEQERAKVAYDNLILSLDKGEGLLSRITGAWYKLKTSIWETFTTMNKTGESFANAQVTSEVVKVKQKELEQLKDIFMKKQFITNEERKTMQNTLVSTGFSNGEEIVNKWIIEKANNRKKDLGTQTKLTKKTEEEKNAQLSTSEEYRIKTLTRLDKERAESYLEYQKDIEDIKNKSYATESERKNAEFYAEKAHLIRLSELNKDKSSKQLSTSEEYRIKTLTGLEKEMAEAVLAYQKDLEDIKNKSYANDTERKKAEAYAEEAHLIKIRDLNEKHLQEMAEMYATGFDKINQNKPVQVGNVSQRTFGSGGLSGKSGIETDRNKLNDGGLSQITNKKPTYTANTELSFYEEESPISKWLNKNQEELDAAKQAAGSVIGVFQDVMAADMEKTDALIANKQAYIDKLKEEEAEEKKAADEGKANSLSAVKAKIAAAEEEQKKLKETKEKQVKQQQTLSKISLAITAAETIANIVESVSKIAKANAGIPFVGVALIAAQTAALFSIFLKAKNMAKAVPAFAEGTDSVQLNGNPKGTDTVLARVNEGEMIIETPIVDQLDGISRHELPKAVKAYRFLNQLQATPDRTAKDILNEQKKTNQILSNKEERYLGANNSEIVIKNGVKNVYYK